MHCIVSANVACLLWPALFLLSRGQEVGKEGAEVWVGTALERRWRREERRRSGELLSVCSSSSAVKEKRREWDRERVCACVREEEDLTERVHTYSSTWQRPVLLHPWIIPICGCQVCCPEHLCGCQVGLFWVLLMDSLETQGRFWSSDQEGQHVETERKCYAKLHKVWNSRIYMSWILNFRINRRVYVTVLCEWIQMHYLRLFYFKALKLILYKLLNWIFLVLFNFNYY